MEWPSVTLVVVNYNGENTIGTCLDSVARLRYPSDRLHVVVVDNGSTDRSLSLIANDYPSVQVMPLRRNRGFAAANNAAIANSQSDYVALLNNDARVSHQWLSALAAAAVDPAVGACTSKLLLDPGVESSTGRACAEERRPRQLIQNAGSCLLRNGSCADRGSLRGQRGYEEDFGQYDSQEEVFAFCGAATLLKRSMLKDVGLFDSSFFMYYEDIDLSWRARARGWRIMYVPGAVAYHRHGSARRESTPRFVRDVERNRLATLAKNASPVFAFRGFVSSTFQLAQTCRQAADYAVRRNPEAAPRSRVALAHSGAIASFIASVPRLLAARQRTSARCTPSQIQKRWVNRS